MLYLEREHSLVASSDFMEDLCIETVDTISFDALFDSGFKLCDLLNLLFLHFFERLSNIISAVVRWLQEDEVCHTRTCWELLRAKDMNTQCFYV